VLHEDDLQTARAAASGDRAAFDRLYERLFEPVHAYLAARVASRAAAEFLTEQVLVRLVSALPHYRGRAPLAALALAEARRALDRCPTASPARSGAARHAPRLERDSRHEVRARPGASGFLFEALE